MFGEIVAEGGQSVGGRLEPGSDEDNSLSIKNKKWRKSFFRKFNSPPAQ